MTTNTDQGTAKIYQFPVRARRPVASRLDAVGSNTAQRLASAGLADCWYHEAAIAQPEAPKLPPRN